MSLNETENKTRFSQEVIDGILTNQPQVPVRINFVGEPIGYSDKFWFDQDGVGCEMEIKQEHLEELNLFVVPEGIVHINEISRDENGTTIINKMQLTGLSITSFPADMTLTKIKKG
jgi:hypothetical protein